MKTIIVTIPVNEKHIKLFEDIVSDAKFVYCSDDDLTKEIVHKANAIIGNPPHHLLKGCTKLEWIQLASSGTDGYLEKGLLPPSTILTNAAGAYGLAVAEHLFALLLFLLKKLKLYSENQREHIWKDEGSVSSIYGTTTLIVGLGDLGKEFAIRMKAFGSHIIGIKRTIQEKPDFVDEVYTIDNLDKQLPRADIVALCLPNSKSTYRMFSMERLLKIKKGAILLNAGRGNLIDTEDLFHVLEIGHLAGAGVDVTDPEPLIEKSKLWDAPNIIITPHVAGGYHLPETLEKIVRICEINLSAFIGKSQYINVICK